MQNLNKDFPEWLKEAYNKYAQQIVEEDLGRRKIQSKFGLTKHKAQALRRLVKEFLSDGIETKPSQQELSFHSKDEFEDSQENEILEDSQNKNFVYNKVNDVYVTFIKDAPPQVIAGAKHREMKRAYSNWDGHSMTIAEIARSFDMPEPWFKQYKRIHCWTHDSSPFTEEELIEKEESDLIEDLIVRKNARIYKQLQKRKWADIQVKAEKWDNLNESYIKPLTAIINERVPNYEIPKANINIPKTGDYADCALVVAPTDFHYGKYAWSVECGEGYSREIAKQRLRDCTAKLMSRLPAVPDTVIIAIGNSDWFHIDADTISTSNGTPQTGIDGIGMQIYSEGCELAVSEIDHWRALHPKNGVKIISLPGNHDRTFSFTAMHWMKAWYQNVDDVEIIFNWKTREYYKFGTTLMGFHHGDYCKHEQLPMLMANEMRKEWGQTDNHIWFTGNFHHKMRREFGDRDGVIQYQLPSLASSDQWHTRKGYVGSKKGLQGHLVHPEEGVISELFVSTKKIFTQ